MHLFFQQQFYLANAARYPGKETYFYPLKAQLLKRQGHYEGWDLQVLAKICWDCGGKGCDSCDYTGEYSRRVYYLQRWRLGERVYHTPVAEQPEGEPQNTLRDIVQHEPIDPKLGRKALIWLIAKYQPLLLARLWLRLKWYQLTGYRSYGYNRVEIDCAGGWRYLVVLASLFTGWQVFDFRKNYIAIGRKKWNPAMEHFKWVLEAWLPKSERWDDIPF